MRLKKRLDRRDRTWRKCRRRFRIQLGQGFVDPAGEAHRNHKRGVNNHNCRRSKHGQPKRGTGCCHGWDPRPAVEERQRGRRICREVLADQR